MKPIIQKSILTTLILLIVSSSIWLVWKSQDLIGHHQSYMLREGVWPTMEMERTLLNLKETLTRMSLGGSVLEEEYLFDRKIAFNRVGIMYRFSKDNPTLSANEMILVEKVRDDLQSFQNVEEGNIPDSESAKRLISVVESAIVSSHDLLNSLRDVTYKANVEAFSHIDQLLTWLSVMLFLLIVASVTIYFSIRQTHRHELKIAQLQRYAAEQEKEVAVSRARVAMASELHDVFNYHLAIIGQKLNRAHQHLRSNPTISDEEILEARARTRLALRDARGSVHALRSGNIQPLEQAIKALDPGGIGVQICVHGTSSTLPDDVAFAAYRITQEAFANTLKHAHNATCIHVALDYQTTRFTLSITDDGEALPHKRHDSQSTTSIGLIGMQERVEQLRGSFQHGRTSQGYHIQAIFPTEPTSHDGDSSFDRR